MGKLYLGTREITPTLNMGSISDDWGSSLHGAITIDNTHVCAPYKCAGNSTITSFSAPNVVSGSLYYTFSNCNGLITVNGLENYSGSLFATFQSCQNLINVPDFNGLIELNSNFGSAFQNCTSLTVAPELDNLEAVIGGKLSGFVYNCTSLITPPTFNSLRIIRGDKRAFAMFFYDCISLITVRFPVLDEIDSEECFGQAFEGCTSITDIYFNSLKTTSFTSNKVFIGMLQNTGAQVIHTIHFPSNLESTIQNLYGYPLFGGTSGYVVLAFDLPATE